MIEGIPVGAYGPTALVGIAILLILTGKLVPRRTYDDVIHDRDEWRAAHRISETARAVAADQVEELLEHARTTDSFIRALPHPGGRAEP
jgi:hypothetical protein